MPSQVKNIDKSYVLELQNGNKSAFDALFLKYGQKLFKFSFSLLKNKEDAQEIVQEAFFRIWSKRAQIDSSKSFKSFLFTISYNLIVDQLRKRLKDQEYREYLTRYFETGCLDFSNGMDYNMLVTQIRNEIEKLPAKRQQIFILSRDVGLSHKEISEKLGISIKTVENQITLALKSIRAAVKEDVLAVLIFMSLFI